MSNIRIADIAKKAGVSAGTVDRVLHNRGRVSAENQDKVEKAIKELGYKPNMTARALVSRKNLSLCALLPVNIEGDYWNSIEKGILSAVNHTGYANMNLDIIYFDQYSSASFEAAASKMKGREDINGAIIATHFEGQVRELAEYLDEKQIAYVFIDSNIEGCNELAYFGLEAYDSGYLTAELTLDVTPERGNVVLVDFIVKEGDVSAQTVRRSNGFIDCFIKREQKERLLFFEFDVNSDASDKDLDTLFMQNSDIKTIVTLNSRSYLIADYLKRKNRGDIKMIGFDLIRRNIEFLQERVVSFLISQHPEKQGYSAIEALFSSIILKMEVEKVNYMPIDIITMANLKYYQDI